MRMNGAETAIAPPTAGGTNTAIGESADALISATTATAGVSRAAVASTQPPVTGGGGILNDADPARTVPNKAGDSL